MKFILAILVALLPGTSAQGSNNAATLEADGRLSTFVTLLDRVGVSPSLGETIFAPTNLALAASENDILGDATLWERHYLRDNDPAFFLQLRALLLWQFVTEGRFTAAQILDGSRQRLENSLGNQTIDQAARAIDGTVLDTFLVETDIITTDGILHITNKAIVPPFLQESLTQVLLNEEQSLKFAFTNMAQLALATGLDSQINQVYDGGLTLLVPPNRRFNRANIDIPDLLRPERLDYTRDFVRCHMITNQSLYEANVRATMEQEQIEEFLLTTELGTSLWVTTTEDRLRFQSIDVLVTDLLSRNGCVIASFLNPRHYQLPTSLFHCRSRLQSLSRHQLASLSTLCV